jgi:DNA polymerase III epsilon subunit-like protein
MTDAPDALLVEVADTETTGFPPGARLVEIGAVRIDLASGVEVARFSTLIDPGIPIPRGAWRVHHISRAMVRGAPDAARALADFWAWHAAGLPLWFHHARFDRDVLAAECARTGVCPPARIDLHCTRNLARLARPGLASYAIAALIGPFGLGIESETHRALDDSRLAARLLAACRAAGTPPHCPCGAIGPGPGPAVAPDPAANAEALHGA